MNVLTKTLNRGGPDAGGRFFIEESAVARECPRVPIVEFVPLLGPAFGGTVMKWPAQDFTAKLFPIRLRVKQVQVPRLVHLIRRGYRMSRRQG